MNYVSYRLFRLYFLCRTKQWFNLLKPKPSKNCPPFHEVMLRVNLNKDKCWFFMPDHRRDFPAIIVCSFISKMMFPVKSLSLQIVEGRRLSLLPAPAEVLKYIRLEKSFHFGYDDAFQYAFNTQFYQQVLADLAIRKIASIRVVRQETQCLEFSKPSLFILVLKNIPEKRVGIDKIML